MAISVENFCGSFAGIVLIAYMSSLTSTAYAATQYALFSSLYALPGKLVAGSSGFVVAAIGYPAFFVMTSRVGIPVRARCRVGGRRGGSPEADAAAPPREAQEAGNRIPGPELPTTARAPGAA